MARGLKRGRTRLIGMVVVDILNPYSVAVLRGVEAACQQHGYTLILCNTGNDEQREKQSLAALRSYSIEGLIVNTQGRNIKSLELQHAVIPIVLIDRRIEGLDFDLVGLDNVQAGRLATAHLIAQGYDAVAFVAPPLAGVSSRAMRAEGFLAAIAEHDACHGEVLEVDLDEQSAVDARVRQFIMQWPGRRVALLASNGMVTLELALMLQRLDLVPLTAPARVPSLESGKVDFRAATRVPASERAVFAHFPPGVQCAIEFPLSGAALVAETGRYIQMLAAA